MRLPLFLTLSIISSTAFASQTPEAEAQQAAKLEFFEKKVRPILVSHCYSCHSADTKPSGGLRVDDRNGLLMGGNAGPAVIAGDPTKGLLLDRILHTDPKKRMPKEGELLTESEVEVLKTWITDGAVWPHEALPNNIGKLSKKAEELKATHWAWQPLSEPKVPEVKDTAWPRTNIDRFILATLEEKKLRPVSEADRATLLRRVTYDLTGLPPTTKEITGFLEDKDSTEIAFARVVDRLLASSAFGERWGRHWLDVARYGESTGPSRNVPYPHAWRYRDYVLDAVNRDVPFDRFIQEQVAGDLLAADSPAERDRLLTATGFLALGVKDVNQRFKVRFIMDNVDEQIDAVTRSVLGLTVSCARCHDHKFDPIPVTDYYALAGIFTSTDHCAGVRNKMGGGGLDYYDPAMLVALSTTMEAAPKEQVEKLQTQVAEAKKAWDDIRGTPAGLKLTADGRPTQRAYRTKYEKLQADLLALTDPAARGHAVHGVRDSKVIADTEVRIRGEAERLGPVVPRGFLSTFTVPGAPEVNPAQSGRLELAQWLTSPNNPLTPRVIVNRVWQHLHGVGIVNTVDNFGVNGDHPSHPALLDYLATRFMREGWSVKKLVREVVLSKSYQLGTAVPEGYREIDPANRLVWRHAPRRQTAEELRDSMLAAAGRLESKVPEGSPAKDLKMIEMRDNGAEARNIHESADRSLTRSVYLPLLRGVTPSSLAAFDPVEQTLVTGQREATTVPTQALYLLNSTFVRQQALVLAEQVVAESGRSDVEALREVYQLTLGRQPTEQEATRAGAFLASYEYSYQDASPPVVLASLTSEPRPAGASDARTDAIPVNPDDVDRTEQAVREETVQPRTPRAAAWMNLVQAIYASAEFRFVR
ncbi:cytochrome c [Roseimicrobium gellanilyticum]|uniref:Cytochrome c n=1 Tax=Roseimicrobium gellanilyticum TaxID=748857 RepID=A0A366HDR5_9BACT|nr:PSD1 and planctomycete cytochrome C domain-containing protein [Roseimicrobium gellanilyticum]RBP40593.1 cytochrome c [Roseimicrobium gellanilyticum]